MTTFATITAADWRTAIARARSTPNQLSAQIRARLDKPMNDSVLVKLDTARVALAECKTAMEAKQIADVAEAARVYLERTNASTETVNRATEIRLLAERQMGEFLKQMPKNVGAKGSVVSGSEREPVKDTTPTLASIGITKKQSATAQKLADLPMPEFQERVAVAKASGGKLSMSAVMGLSRHAKTAGERAEQESETLWKLKHLWKKAKKADRAAFKAWIEHTSNT